MLHSSVLNKSNDASLPGYGFTVKYQVSWSLLYYNEFKTLNVEGPSVRRARLFQMNSLAKLVTLKKRSVNISNGIFISSDFGCALER